MKPAVERPIKEEKDVQEDQTGVDLVLDDYDTVIRLPRQNTRSSHNQHGFAISFYAQGTIRIRRRNSNGRAGNKVKCEPIVIGDDKDESEPVVIE